MNNQTQTSLNNGCVRGLELLLIILLMVTGYNQHVIAQQTPTPAPEKQVAPEVLPGKGPAEFDFFYAGEAKNRNMYIVKGGKIVWSYIDTIGKGEISDAVLMTNGNILFAHQFGITLIDRNKKVLWNYDTPKGHEIHTAQPIGKEHVVFIQNGDTAKLIVMNIRTNKIENQFVLPVGNPKNVHPQFRHARLTSAGTIMVAHMDMGKVVEYDSKGTALWSTDMKGVWSVEPLKNGNFLLAATKGPVREVNRKGDVVWEYTLNDIPGYQIASAQIATRLANGNTIVNNWFNTWQYKLDPSKLPVQAIEVTPDKKIIWALRAWADPINLGPSTTIELLKDENRTTEKVHFGDIK